MDYFKVLFLGRNYPSNQPVTYALFLRNDNHYLTPNSSAMHTLDPKAEIAALERECFHYKRLLAKAILGNVELLKAKIIYKKLKAINNRIEQLKKLK